jgi:hypothetical protein
MSLKIENSRRDDESRPVCVGLYKLHKIEFQYIKLKYSKFCLQKFFIKETMYAGGQCIRLTRDLRSRHTGRDSAMRRDFLVFES